MKKIAVEIELPSKLYKDLSDLANDEGLALDEMIVEILQDECSVLCDSDNSDYGCDEDDEN